MKRGKTMDKNILKARIIIPCRFAYINCWRPSTQYGGVQKYSVSAIVSKDDIETIEVIENAINYVIHLLTPYNRSILVINLVLELVLEM